MMWGKAFALVWCATGLTETVVLSIKFIELLKNVVVLESARRWLSWRFWGSWKKLNNGSQWMTHSRVKSFNHLRTLFVCERTRNKTTKMSEWKQFIPGIFATEIKWISFLTFHCPALYCSDLNRGRIAPLSLTHTEAQFAPDSNPSSTRRVK